MNIDSTGAVVVLITTATHDEAVHLGEMLVESRLAACVQILPQMESIYRWNNEISRDSEYLLLVKTTRDCLELLESSVREIHSYEIPEIVVLSVLAGSSGYLNWLTENVRPPD